MRNILLAGSGLALLGALSLGVPAIAATQAGATTFTVKITNVSQDDTIKVPGADSVKAPIAPGVFLVDPARAIFELGKPASAELQGLAEDGNFEPMEKMLRATFGERAGMFAPGLEFTLTAQPGDLLSFATMFVQSNDKFYAPKQGAIALFDADGEPVNGDLTALVRLHDAGTELDQLPGAGSDQAPRQKAANTGAAQEGVVAEANDGFAYPALADVIRLEISIVQ